MLTSNPILICSAFVCVFSLVMLVAMILNRLGADANATATVPKRSRNDDWADTAEDAMARRSTFHRMGSMLMPQENTKASKLKQRLLQAGLYKRHSTGFYLAAKLILLMTPMVVGIGLVVGGFLSLPMAILFGAVVGLVGNMAPGMWLSRLKAGRQKEMRRALPDALDVIVICMEGGLSLPASFAKVSTELRYAHPLLASEMSIARREIQLGRPTGDALRQLADRFDLDELRSLASVVNQAERFGASLTHALVIHADALRMKRYQSAEAMAQKAPVKLVFPTVLCIFPALYVVLMGPAGVQLYNMLNELGN